MVEEEDAPDPEEMSVIEKLHQMLGLDGAPGDAPNVGFAAG